LFLASAVEEEAGAVAGGSCGWEGAGGGGAESAPRAAGCELHAATRTRAAGTKLRHREKLIFVRGIGERFKLLIAGISVKMAQVFQQHNRQ
jgi:hypothetical protein